LSGGAVHDKANAGKDDAAIISYNIAQEKAAILKAE
jgi:hypothetical protein